MNNLGITKQEARAALASLTKNFPICAASGLAWTGLEKIDAGDEAWLSAYHDPNSYAELTNYSDHFGLSLALIASIGGAVDERGRPYD